MDVCRHINERSSQYMDTLITMTPLWVMEYMIFQKHMQDLQPSLLELHSVLLYDTGSMVLWWIFSFK